jgi:hypothetical protein
MWPSGRCRLNWYTVWVYNLNKQRRSGKHAGSNPAIPAKMTSMETLKQIVSGTLAKMSHVCNGKAYYTIDTAEHQYQLEIDCLDKEWKDVYVLPKYKAITLMRWIRKGIEKDNGTFMMLK